MVGVGVGVGERRSDCGGLHSPVISWEGEVRGGLARVSGWIDHRQHADTHRPEQISFKIDCTNKNCYRAHLPTSITVKRALPQGRGDGRSSRSHALVHTVPLCLILITILSLDCFSRGKNILCSSYSNEKYCTGESTSGIWRDFSSDSAVKRVVSILTSPRSSFTGSLTVWVGVGWLKCDLVYWCIYVVSACNLTIMSCRDRLLHHWVDLFYSCPVLLLTSRSIAKGSFESIVEGTSTLATIMLKGNKLNRGRWKPNTFLEK